MSVVNLAVVCGKVKAVLRFVALFLVFGFRCLIDRKFGHATHGASVSFWRNLLDEKLQLLAADSMKDFVRL